MTMHLPLSDLTVTKTERPEDNFGGSNRGDRSVVFDLPTPKGKAEMAARPEDPRFATNAARLSTADTAVPESRDMKGSPPIHI